MNAKKRPDLKALVLKLIAEKTEINIHDVAMASGLSKSDETDRKAIRRVLNSLIQSGRLKAIGAARARVYVRADETPSSELASSVSSEPFRTIRLSPSSQSLLKYLSQPLLARTPVGYNQDFLLSYEPNKSSYLDDRRRADLLTWGRAENVIRPAGTYARNIIDRLLIDLSWNSSRIEGNTYSLLETKRLIEIGEIAEGKDATEAQMILGHKAAIEYIVESATETGITTHDVYSIHALLSVARINKMIASRHIPAPDAPQVFGIIELEIASLHDGNIARFKIRPSEYLAWKAK